MINIQAATRGMRAASGRPWHLAAAIR